VENPRASIFVTTIPLNRSPSVLAVIGDVRGTGFILGVELVTDRQLKTPAKEEICHAMEHMKDMGVLVGKGGFYGNVFRITPPLCFSKEDADFFVEVMDVALSKL
jgi:alanine-glyoxylate transaminase/(R)-3-amino-2-methylpropionate-pyruvate transaminase